MVLSGQIGLEYRTRRDPLPSRVDLPTKHLHAYHAVWFDISAKRCPVERKGGDHKWDKLRSQGGRGLSDGVNGRRYRIACPPLCQVQQSFPITELWNTVTWLCSMVAEHRAIRKCRVWRQRTW